MKFSSVAKAAAVSALVADISGAAALALTSFLKLLSANGFEPWDLYGDIYVSALVGFASAAEFLFIALPVGVLLGTPFHIVAVKWRLGIVFYALMGLCLAALSIKLVYPLLMSAGLDSGMTAGELIGVCSGAVGGLFFWRKTREDTARSLTRQSVIASVVAMGIILGGAQVLDWVGHEPCEASVRRTIPAPDGAMAAVVFEMGCGATVPFNTQVSIVPADMPFSPSRFPSFLSLNGQLDLDVTWAGNAAVEIRLPPDATVYRKEPQAAGVAVVYR